MMQDIKMPLCSSGLDFSTNSMDSFGYSKQKLLRHDGHSGELDSYYGSRRIFDHAENCSKDKWDGKYFFLWHSATECDIQHTIISVSLISSIDPFPNSYPVFFFGQIIP